MTTGPNPEQPAAPPAPAKSWLRRYLPLIVLVAAAVFVVLMGWHRYLTLEQLAANRDALRSAIEESYLRSLLIYMAIYVAVVALSLPGGALLTLTGGFLFGWIAGGIATVVAATLGATLL
ncbi:MAG: TVP38/TMEM64 family protein, partial [Pseudomonadota bacterium]|nr:TVP38/TMEM64 family protein [Pseudomonadota bacterium]